MPVKFQPGKEEPRHYIFLASDPTQYVTLEQRPGGGWFYTTKPALLAEAFTFTFAVAALNALAIHHPDKAFMMIPADTSAIVPEEMRRAMRLP